MLWFAEHDAPNYDDSLRHCERSLGHNDKDRTHHLLSAGQIVLRGPK